MPRGSEPEVAFRRDGFSGTTTMRASLVNQLRVLVPVKRTIDYGSCL